MSTDPYEYRLTNLLTPLKLMHPEDEHTKDTGRRLLKYLRYWTEEPWVGTDGAAFRPTIFPNENPTVDQMIHVAPISFWSCCSHHLLPFHGHAWVSYIPGEWLIGLSKISQIVRRLAKKPQVQEHLTQEIAHYLEDLLEPVGLGIQTLAHHTCQMLSVGPDAPLMKITDVRGVCRTSPAARQEFLEAIKCQK